MPPFTCTQPGRFSTRAQQGRLPKSRMWWSIPIILDDGSRQIFLFTIVHEPESSKVNTMSRGHLTSEISVEGVNRNDCICDFVT